MKELDDLSEQYRTLYDALMYRRLRKARVNVELGCATKEDLIVIDNFDLLVKSDANVMVGGS